MKKNIEISSKILNKQAPGWKIVRCHRSPLITKYLFKTIMTRNNLRNKFWKNKIPIAITWRSKEIIFYAFYGKLIGTTIIRYTKRRLHNTPWTQDLNLEYIRRSRDVQNVFSTSYVRSTYVLSLGGWWISGIRKNFILVTKR